MTKQTNLVKFYLESFLIPVICQLRQPYTCKLGSA